MSGPSIDQLVNKLKLEPHPEGGYYRQTFLGDRKVSLEGQEYPAGTSIYYLLRSYDATGDFSAWHKLKSLDETWHHHEGTDLIIHWLTPQGDLVTKKLGKGENAEYQINVPRNCWFSAYVDNPDPNAYSLVACTVFPGFEFKNFELAGRQDLSVLYPQHALLIEKLTRDRPAVDIPSNPPSPPASSQP